MPPTRTRIADRVADAEASWVAARNIGSTRQQGATRARKPSERTYGGEAAPEYEGAKKAVLKTFGFQNDFCTIGFEPEIPEMHLLAHGGAGSGKTYGGASRTALYALKYPRCRMMMTAPTMDMMRQATLPTFFDVLDTLGFRAGYEYQWNKNDREIYFTVNGSLIFVRSTEEYTHLQGPTIGAAWMDEPRFSAEQAYDIVARRCRAPGIPHHLWLTTTPQGKDHWLYRVFYDQEHTGGLVYKTYPASMLDNPFLSDEYKAAQISRHGLDTRWGRQEILGEFVMYEGLVYPEFDRNYHVKDEDEWPVKHPNKVIAGVDFGYESPCCILVEGYDSEGRRYILDEFYKDHILPEDRAVEAERLINTWGIREFICDVEDPGNIEYLRRRLHPRANVRKAKREVLQGKNHSSSISLCAAALRNKLKDGSQAFFVSPRCKNWIREIENYVHVPDRDDRNPMEMPRKLDDHALDAWRYVETRIKRIWDTPEPARRVWGPMVTVRR